MIHIIRMWRPVVAAAMLAAIALALGSAGSAPRQAAAATFTVNSTLDGSDAAAGNGVCQTATPGQCTLRAAIEEANALAGTDTINFNITPSGPKTISPGSPLPLVSGAVTIDGRTQPGWSGSPIIELDGSLAGGGANGIRVGVVFVSVYGFVINDFGGNGIQVEAGGAFVGGNDWIGLNLAGTAAAPNSRGINNSGGSITLGSTASNLRSVISGNTFDGIRQTASASTTSLIRGVYIGTNPAGTSAIPNGESGIETAVAATIGAAHQNYHNVISGNTGDGISISTAGIVSVNYNHIGVNATNTGALGNGGHGIATTGTSGPGGVSIGTNVIANNGGDGVNITAGSSVHVRNNSIHSNAGDGIDLVGGANAGIAAPVISGFAPLSGTTCGSCPVDIYSDAAGEGLTYHATVTATAGGAWTYYGRIDGPFVTAVTDAYDGSSEFSAAVAMPPCGSVCLEGFWHVDYLGSGPQAFCSNWTNQIGTTTFWGHMSCTSGLESDFTGSLTQGTMSLTASVVYPGGVTVTANGTFAIDGNTASGTWSCTIGCIGSGTWSGARFGTGELSIPAGGGTVAFGAGAPLASITAPAGSPAITVKSVALTGSSTTRPQARTGYEFLPDGQTFTEFAPVTIEVDFGGGQNAIPNDNCWGLFHEVQDPLTLVWSFASLIDCDNLSNTFEVEILGFSVHRFATCPVVTTGTHADGNFIDLPPSKAYDDLTRAYSDAYDDGPCDPDDDNDGRSDIEEISGENCGGPFRFTDPADEDSDDDRYLDGAECDLNANPTTATSKPTDTACGGNGDLDGDGLPNFRETCKYNTDATDPDTDRSLMIAGTDYCNDGEELASINADKKVNSIDLSQVAQHFGPSTNPSYILDFDFTRDDNINSIDLSQIAQRFTGADCTP